MTYLSPFDYPNESVSNKTIEILDRVGEFCDKGISREKVTATLHAQYVWSSLFDAARYLNRHTTQDSNMAEIIVSTIYNARTHPDRNGFIAYGCVSEFDSIEHLNTRTGKEERYATV